MSKITFLGTGTAEISTERSASSLLIEIDDTKFVFDMGWGTALKLTELGIKQNDISHILFSHYHIDHVSDLLPYLHSARQTRDTRTSPLTLIGPKGIKKLYDQVMDLFSVFDLDKLPFKFPINVQEIRDKETIDIGGVGIEFISLPTDGNHGIRFKIKDKSICITGDSYYHQQEVDFLKNSDVAIVDGGHIMEDELIDLAIKSQAREIYATHIYKELDPVNINQKAAMGGYLGKIIMAEDLTSIDI